MGRPESPIISINDNFELRLPLEEDAFQLSRVVEENRSYLKKWLPWLDNSRSVEDALTFIRKTHMDWSLHNLFTGMIYRKNEIAGVMGFHTRSHRYSVVGYWVAKSYSGQGLCTSAVRAISAWAFEHYDDLNLIELRAASENVASRRVAEKAGFTQEGTLRQREWLYDHFVDHVIYSLSREELQKGT